MIILNTIIKYKYFFLALICVGGSFLWGRYSVQPETKTVVQTVVQTTVQHAEQTDIDEAVTNAKKEWESQVHTVTKTVIVRQKNGVSTTTTVVDTEKTSQATSTVTDTTKNVDTKTTDTTTQTKTDTTTKVGPSSEEDGYSVGVLVQLDKWNDINTRTYNVVGGVRVAGPLWINGGFNWEKKSPSLGLSISF